MDKTRKSTSGEMENKIGKTNFEPYLMINANNSGLSTFGM
jgi:hypothetical protein